MEHKSILSKRYSSKEMSSLFCEQTKFSTWRFIWVALAKAQKHVGLTISQEQIDELEQHMHHIDFEKAEHYEAQLQHDVMAHIRTYADQCPQAAPIIHLGATSCLVTDNAELIIMRKALLIIQDKLGIVIANLASLANQYKNIACLSFTHFQPAQPTTVGKRICLWLQDFVIDFTDLEQIIKSLSLLGLKGATGTQATFLQLCNGNHDQVIKLEKLFCKELGFDNVFPITGQTYTRKQDIKILNSLNAIAVSAHKIATDLRLLAHMQEIEEPISQMQVGSSAMPYKRNPMLSERVCSLARYVMSLATNPSYTAATQWLERTLDDSANRRLCIPDAFMAADAVLKLLIKITDKLVVNKKIIERNVQRELPFMATESLLMAAVQNGADRQQMHERIRIHCRTVQENMKTGDGTNDLLQRIAQDPEIPLTAPEINSLLQIKNFIGRAPEQVTEFLQSIHSIIGKNNLEFNNGKTKNNLQTSRC